MSNSDIYEYQFNSLFSEVKTLIGKTPLLESHTDPVEQFEHSNLLFDVGGIDFNFFKYAETEYRYWVEVYILKIIENLLTRYDISFKEKYYPDSNEQYSITINYQGKIIEMFFLFDIVYEQSNCTDYNIIGDHFHQKCNYADDVNIFIFRDKIVFGNLADMVNGDPKMNGNGFVSIFPLKEFFNRYFSESEYEIFLEYANEFYDRCNSIISYKTVITPTKKTLVKFKKIKEKMLRSIDYKKIYCLGLSGTLDDHEFDKVQNNYLNNRMFQVMVSNSDYADSFISAEWSYDIYRNAMGELELTGIIAGYLKSVEQLLFSIARFYVDKGLKIKTKNGHDYYTKDNEDIIDSTLGSLNYFVTDKNAKLAISAKVRGCIRCAIDTWKTYQRNGYFHKHNLYRKDNKIEEVRLLTLYLYFLILGGIDFTSSQIEELGVTPEENTPKKCYNETDVFPQFKTWFENINRFDLSDHTSGIWCLLLLEEDRWVLHPYNLKYFDIMSFENNDFEFGPDTIVLNHLHNLPDFSWLAETENSNDGLSQANSLFDRLIKTSSVCNKIDTLIVSSEKNTLLVYYAHWQEYLDSIENEEL